MPPPSPQAAGKSASDIDAVAGKFFLDRAPVAKHLSLAGTQESAEARDALWEECKRTCAYDPDDSEAAASASARA